MEATCDICIDIKEFDIYVHVNSNITKCGHKICTYQRAFELESN